MKTLEEYYDVVVVGAGHAGCEAALAAARLGCETIIFTVSMNSVALMPCNPNIGGSSKGHLVKEIDALGGEMGKNIDKTYIQSKMLNKSKGPAVHSLRAQADKDSYSMRMRYTLQNTDHLTLRQAEVTELLVEEGKVKGVKTFSGAVYHGKAVVLATGTYLKARCLYGDVVDYTGPNGLQAANHLSQSLREHGIELYRFKTGTPARIDKRSVDFSVMEEQFGDEKVVPFSFTNKEEDIRREQVSCWLTYTNEKTHEIIRENLDRSPLYSGVIEGTGPRYCPSIEDKVVRFADKKRHQLFIEPEGEFTNEMYVGGMSSSLPEDVQYAMYRSVKGLENVKIIRNAYAIEYDCINPNQLKLSLEFKNICGLFSGGQFNGSSGYEEAAGQGLLAGINAARFCKKEEPIILDRSQAYIGVLIDDLVTKENHEPYRMMTSRAEYRLLLRQDNADMRLTDLGHEIGLIDEERYEAFCEKRKRIEKEIGRLRNTTVGANKEVQELLIKNESTPLKSAATLAELIKRPELNYECLDEIDKKRETLDEEIIEQVNINLKYEGYISRQKKQVEQFKKMEKKLIPVDIHYEEIHNLRKEAVQKLNDVRPYSIGQASRISGVSPSDISVLLIYMEQIRHRKGKEDA
ncbi:MAG: tRNA uridine-5-carboxymethylaminomethyl(34) synthesis enzyme MnmG [Eubacteriales bacterium]|nr:tRNA uridine-5-carboxymethylaminomethyl(34) synthesis enzyme MnmG [Eubacteriales bacterium]